MSGKIDVRDIPADVRRKLGVKLPRRRPQMTMHDVRTYSLRVLAVIADLDQAGRRRVLRQALKVNDV